MSAAWPQFLMDASIVGLIRGYACRNRGSNFYVLLISSLGVIVRFPLAGCPLGFSSSPPSGSGCFRDVTSAPRPMVKSRLCLSGCC